MSAVLDQRIRARDWQNVAKIEGRSIHAVRIHYAGEYDGADHVEALTPRLSDLAVIQQRAKALRWTAHSLADAACANREYVACILRGTVDLTEGMRDRLSLAMDIAESAKLERAA
jgi:hypothetical protein